MRGKSKRNRGIQVIQPQFGEYVQERIHELRLLPKAFSERYYSLLKKKGFLIQSESAEKYLQRIKSHQTTIDEGYLELLCEALEIEPRTLAELGLILFPLSSNEGKQWRRWWHLPYLRNPFFTGREAILMQLRQALVSGKAALTQSQALSGLGGIGKTQTAVEYVYRYCDDYQAALWMKADSREKLVSDFMATATLLGLPDQNPNRAVAAVKRWLEENAGWLLIFDNADEPQMLEDFLPLAPQGHILLTSRAQVFDNLGIANPIRLEKMMPMEAEMFLLKRVGRDNPSPAEIEAVRRLAEKLDYLPLALEQGGSYIRKLSCSFQDYLSSYRRHGLGLLEKMGAVTGKYPQSVMTTWSLNFEQVEKASEAAADILRISAFLHPDSIPLEIFTRGAKELGSAISAALANADEESLAIDEALLPLTQQSLIQRDPESRTYSIHRLVQAALKAKMDKAAQKTWAERAVRAVNATLSNHEIVQIEFSDFPHYERLLSQARACARLIEEWNFEFKEAERLLHRTAVYLYYRYDRLVQHEVEKLFQRALEIAEKVYGGDDPRYASILHYLAGIYRRQGKHTDAEFFYQRALAIVERVLGPDHPTVAGFLNKLGEFYRVQRRYIEAERFLQQALAIGERGLGEDHFRYYYYAESLRSLALTYHNQGRYAEAEPLYRSALAIQEEGLGERDPNVGESLARLGSLYVDQGKYAEAELLLQRSLQIQEAAYDKEHPRIATSLQSLARLYHYQGRYAEAEPLYQRALALREKVLGTNHPQTQSIREDYERCRCESMNL